MFEATLNFPTMLDMFFVLGLVEPEGDMPAPTTTGDKTSEEALKDRLQKDKRNRVKREQRAEEHSCRWGS